MSATYRGGAHHMPNGSAQEWETNWRKGVNETMATMDGKLDTMLQLIQRFDTRLSLNEQAVKDMTQARRMAPEEVRQWVFLLFSAAALLFSLVNILSAHWH